MGSKRAYLLYVSLIVAAYLALSAAVLFGWLPTTTLLAMLSLPLFVRAIKNAELGVMGQQRAIAMIDLQTAQLQALFGLLLVIGLVWAALTTLPR
jgi:1,4-dihydroxy-2-naphthoate octaprenyltransferase